MRICPCNNRTRSRMLTIPNVVPPLDSTSKPFPSSAGTLMNFDERSAINVSKRRRSSSWADEAVSWAFIQGWAQLSWGRTRKTRWTTAPLVAEAQGAARTNGSLAGQARFLRCVESNSSRFSSWRLAVWSALGEDRVGATAVSQGRRIPRLGGNLDLSRPSSRVLIGWVFPLKAKHRREGQHRWFPAAAPIRARGLGGRVGCLVLFNRRRKEGANRQAVRCVQGYGPYRSIETLDACEIRIRGPIDVGEPSTDDYAVIAFNLEKPRKPPPVDADNPNYERND